MLQGKLRRRIIVDVKVVRRTFFFDKKIIATPPIFDCGLSQSLSLTQGNFFSPMPPTRESLSLRPMGIVLQSIIAKHPHRGFMCRLPRHMLNNQNIAWAKFQMDVVDMGVYYHPPPPSPSPVPR